MTKESDKQKGKRKNETQLGKKAWKSDKPRSKKKTKHRETNNPNMQSEEVWACQRR